MSFSWAGVSGGESVMGGSAGPPRYGRYATFVPPFLVREPGERLKGGTVGE